MNIKEITPYSTRIALIHQELNIPENYAVKYGLALQPEAENLTSIGTDIFDRPQSLTAKAAQLWDRMKIAADNDGVKLDIVSAFRSVDYQHQIFQRKLAKGQTISQILAVNAAPGFSEHHTGNALDLATDDCEPLIEAFDETAAFKWLTQHATQFSFYLSYPKNNPHKIIYEPWHWMFHEKPITVIS